MKHIFIGLAFIFMALAGCLPAQAALFLDFIDFAGQTQPTLHYTYQDVADNAKFSWVHSILDDWGGYALSEVTLLDAELALTYAKTEGNENWTLAAFGGLLKTADQPLTTAFALTQGQLSLLQLSGQLTVTPSESTTGSGNWCRA